MVSWLVWPLFVFAPKKQTLSWPRGKVEIKEIWTKSKVCVWSFNCVQYVVVSVLSVLSVSCRCCCDMNLDDLVITVPRLQFTSWNVNRKASTVWVHKLHIASPSQLVFLNGVRRLQSEGYHRQAACVNHVKSTPRNYHDEFSIKNQAWKFAITLQFLMSCFNFFYIGIYPALHSTEITSFRIQAKVVF